jgi:hypothetical protein
VSSTERGDGHMGAVRHRIILVIGLAIVAAGCGPAAGGPPASGVVATISPSSPATAAATSGAAQSGGTTDDVLSIESNTQAHVGQLAIGAGNFSEDEYTPPGEAPRRGLTAGLWLSYREEPAQNRHLRVYAGQEIVVPGYRLHIIAVEPTIVRLAIRREP